MKKILVVLGGGRAKGNTAQLAEAFINGAREAGHQVESVSLNKMNVSGCTGCNACRYGKPCVQKDDFFQTFEQAVSYYKFTMINYIGFYDKGILLAGGCGDTNGAPQINKTNHLKKAYEFGKSIYAD